MKHDNSPFHPDSYLMKFAGLLQGALKWFLYRKCADCGGEIPISDLQNRSRGWPQFSSCKSCDAQWRIALTFCQYSIRFVLVCFPFVLFGLYVTSVFLQFVFPAVIYETETGLRKMHGWAFPFLAIGFFLPVLVWGRRLPLEKGSK